MGLSNETTNISMVAKLTPFGRQELLRNSSSSITHFALGDSDANYGTTYPLETGEMPDISGNLSRNGNSNNSTADGYKPRSLLYADAMGNKKKKVQTGSDNVINSKNKLGRTTLSASSMTYDIVSLADYDTDSRVNWFYSFRLPITASDKALFGVSNSSSGGYADTAYSAISQDEILVVGIPSTEYGEMIDGKSIKMEISGNTMYSIYSTYQKTLTPNKNLDASYKETSFNSAIFGNNIAFLFSDNIQPPNNDSTLTWGSKYGTTKAFTNGKLKFNYKADNNTSTFVDKIVGIAYLDKGLIVITDPTIVGGLGGTITDLTGSTTVQYDSISTQVTQEITCIADRGEFGTSSNTTYNIGDTTRISEIILLDKDDNVMAVAKPDRHIEKSAQQFLALGVKISV